MNESNVGGKLDELAGKVKQGFGEAFGNEKVANDGAAQEVKGHAEQTWGNVKDTASDLTDQAHANAQAHTTEAELHAEHKSSSIRQDITDAAEHAKESITRGLDHLKGN